MKKLVRGILDGGAALAALLVSYNLSKGVNYFFKAVYSNCVRRVFSKIGPGAHIEFPAVINGGAHMTVGAKFHASARLRLEACAKFGGQTFSPSVTIGDNVDFNYDCHIGCINKIVIGDNVLAASKVLIMDHSHGEITAADMALPPSARKLVSKGPIVIGKNVWIGEGAAILAGVTIGESSIIGANAVVTRDVPPFSVAAGNPARVIKTLK